MSAPDVFVKKIVFLVSSTFNRRDEKRFGIEILQRNGFEVEVWDFTPFLNPARFEMCVPPDPTSFEHYHVIPTRREARSALSKLPPRSLVFCLLNYEYGTYSIYRTMSKHRLPYGVLSYSVPAYHVPRAKSILARVKNLTVEKLFLYLFSVIPFRFLGVEPATMMLALGEEYSSTQFPVDARTEIVWAHYFDYDVYLDHIKEPIQTDQSMGVFLDNYLPFHPDAIDDPLLAAEEYYPLLRSFFDYIESNYGVHMVVAAHPRSEYEKHGDCFGARPVIRGKTSELVMQAGFVMLHSSASIAFAVLFKKPIVFLTTDRLRQGRAGKIIGSLIDFMAPRLGKQPINLNDGFDIDWTKELAIDEDAYREYKNKYIKKEGTDELPLWQIFANRLKTWKGAGTETL